MTAQEYLQRTAEIRKQHDLGIEPIRQRLTQEILSAEQEYAEVCQNESSMATAVLYIPHQPTRNLFYSYIHKWLEMWAAEKMNKRKDNAEVQYNKDVQPFDDKLAEETCRTLA